MPQITISIDEEVKKIHSYKTYNLVMTKVEKINNKAFEWLQNSLLHPNVTM